MLEKTMHIFRLTHAYAGDVCKADFDVERPELRAVVAGDLVVPAVAVGVERPLSREAGRLDVPHGLTAAVAAAAAPRAGPAQLPYLLLGRRRDLALALLLEHLLPLFPASLLKTERDWSE